MNIHDRLLPIESLTADSDRSLSELAAELVDDPIEIGARIAGLIELREAAEAAELQRLSATAQALEAACRDLVSADTFDTIVRLVGPAVAAIADADSVLFTTLDGLLGTPHASFGPSTATTATELFLLPQEFADSGVPMTFRYGGRTVFRVDVDGRAAAALHVDATLDSAIVSALNGYAEALGSALERTGLEQRQLRQTRMIQTLMRLSDQPSGSGPLQRAMPQRTQPEIACSGEVLTHRETEILNFLLTGASNAAIAADLIVSIETVRALVT